MCFIFSIWYSEPTVSVLMRDIMCLISVKFKHVLNAFNFSQFLGTWHDVALASTCPHIQSHRSDAAIGKLVLQRGATADKLKATRTVLRFVWSAYIILLNKHTHIVETNRGSISPKEPLTAANCSRLWLLSAVKSAVSGWISWLCQELGSLGDCWYFYYWPFTSLDTAWLGAS